MHVESIMSLGEKLNLSLNTIHLSISFMDTYVSKNPNGYEIASTTLPIVCVLLGAKSIELDNRIPFLSKLKRYADTFATISELKKLEMEVCSVLDWKLQKSTNLDILEHLLTLGIVFERDSVQGSIEKDKINETTKRIEREAYFLSNRVVKDVELLSLEPLVLACVSIAFLRKLNWVSPIWNPKLTEITGIDISDFESSLKLFEGKMTKNPLVDLSNFSKNITSTKLIKSHSNIDHIRISKRHSTTENLESQPSMKFPSFSRHQSMKVGEDLSNPSRPAILGAPPAMKRDSTDYFHKNFDTGKGQENSFISRKNSKLSSINDMSYDSLITSNGRLSQSKGTSSIFDDITNKIERHLKL